MYHFFSSPENIDGEKVRITGPNVNHIKNVLRMKPGDELLVSDGAGTDYTCAVECMDDDEIVCRITGEGESLSEPSVRFYLFQGLPKADKFEHIIQKSVELGVYEIIPVKTARSIVKYDDKKAKAKNERWGKISESAAKQSRRGIVPQVKDICTFDEAVRFVSDEKNGISMGIIPYENFKDMNATREILKEIRPGMSVAIFVGPEGGFEEQEVMKANEAGIRSISLGNRILRTETAPLMLLSVLTFALE